jgi:hypothetical protein
MLTNLRHQAENGHDDAKALLHLLDRADKRDQDVAKFVDSYSKTIAALCRRLEALERGARLRHPVEDAEAAESDSVADAAQRITDYAAKAGLKVQDWAKAFNAAPVDAGPMNRADAALKAEPEGPSEKDLYDLAAEFNGDPVPAMRRALEVWGNPPQGAPAPAAPATPPAPEPGEVGEVAQWLHAHALDCRVMGRNAWAELCTRAAVLLQQQCAPPALDVGEVAELVEWLTMLRDHSKGVASNYDDKLKGLATLLQQQEAELAALRGVPVAVSERPWDREGWCDEQGRCWFCNAYSMGRWSYDTPPDPEQDWGRLGTLTHSLPHWAIQRPRAIPLPAPQAGEVEA